MTANGADALIDAIGFLRQHGHHDAVPVIEDMLHDERAHETCYAEVPDSPALEAAARALYIADHAHNPYAPTDWDQGTTGEHARYVGQARTVISTYRGVINP